MRIFEKLFPNLHKESSADIYRRIRERDGEEAAKLVKLLIQAFSYGRGETLYPVKDFLLTEIHKGQVRFDFKTNRPIYSKNEQDFQFPLSMKSSLFSDFVKLVNLSHKQFGAKKLKKFRVIMIVGDLFHAISFRARD